MELTPVESLNVIDDDADKCCRHGLIAFFPKSIDTDQWICADCGQAFRLQLVSGSIRYWRIVEHFAVVRPR